MARQLDLGRDEAELLVELLDTVYDEDFRYAEMNERIRALFGMVTRAREIEFKQKEG